MAYADDLTVTTRTKGALSGATEGLRLNEEKGQVYEDHKTPR
jgi:hypothetical protein